MLSGSSCPLWAGYCIIPVLFFSGLQYTALVPALPVLCQAGFVPTLRAFLALYAGMPDIALWDVGKVPSSAAQAPVHQTRAAKLVVWPCKAPLLRGNAVPAARLPQRRGANKEPAGFVLRQK